MVQQEQNRLELNACKIKPIFPLTFSLYFIAAAHIQISRVKYRRQGQEAK